MHTIQSIRNEISRQEVVVVRFTDEVDNVDNITYAMLDNHDWAEHLQKSFIGIVALGFNVICGRYEDVDYFYDAYRAYKGMTPAHELTLLSDDANQWVHDEAIEISNFYEDYELATLMHDLGLLQD